NVVSDRVCHCHKSRGGVEFWVSGLFTNSETAVVPSCGLVLPTPKLLGYPILFPHRDSPRQGVLSSLRTVTAVVLVSCLLLATKTGFSFLSAALPILLARW